MNLRSVTPKEFENQKLEPDRNRTSNQVPSWCAVWLTWFCFWLIISPIQFRLIYATLVVTFLLNTHGSEGSKGPAAGGSSFPGRRNTMMWLDWGLEGMVYATWVGEMV